MENKAKSKPGDLRFFFRYLSWGLLLGLGAPVGSLYLRSLGSHSSEVLQWVRQEFFQNQWFYIYMTIGTVTAFCAAAFFAAIQHRQLKERAQILMEKTRALEDRSEKDPMTGLYNFGYIRPRLAIEIERSKRFKTPLSCLMLDIDNLKSVNDSYGHQAGDEVILKIARALQSEIRLIDTATRYAGDEFLLILPVTSQTGAKVVAERILRKVHDLQVLYQGNQIKTSVSVGVSVFPAGGIEDVDSFVAAADKALYQAKRGGRDQVALLPVKAFSS